jgi:hypothetical protein
MGVLIGACATDDWTESEEVEAEEVGVAEDELSNGWIMSPTTHRVAKINGGCTGTVIDQSWVLTARHCLKNNAAGTSDDKDPSVQTVHLGGLNRDVTHVTLHPDHLQSVDVAMLRLETPFTNITQDELPLYGGDTDDFIGENVLCAGYGGTGLTLTGGWSDVLVDTVYGNPDRFYLLDQPNQNGQSLVAGDSGSSCRWDNQIIGVHKGAGQVSVEAFGDWAEKRRDCPGFDPNNPTTSFCSEACPCDVGEGDCDSNAKCQPGLYCRLADAGNGLPANYSVCDRVPLPAPFCEGTFDRSEPSESFCRWSDLANCSCAHGEGDCEDDHDCGGSLECQDNSGFAVGLPSNYDICVYPVAPGCEPYRPEVDDPAFCTTTCPCDLGQGDCDTDAECRAGLVCDLNSGAEFGKPASFGMCVRP